MRGARFPAVAGRQGDEGGAGQRHVGDSQAGQVTGQVVFGADGGATTAQDGGQVQDAERGNTAAAGPLAEHVVIAPQGQPELGGRGDARLGRRGLPRGRGRAGQLAGGGLQLQSLAGQQV